MNPPKCNDLDYIHFLIAAQKVFTCSEAARCQPEEPGAPAHDAFTRLLQRQPPDTEALWQEARALVEPTRGLLVLDDTTLDKPYARRMVKGIALMSLLWTEGQALIPLVYRRQSVPKGIVPCDFRVYDKPSGGKSKNAHFLEMLRVAKGRGFAPAYVLMDSWYASLENLKEIAGLGWRFLTRLKGNRRVNPDGAGNRPVSEVEIPPAGRVVHLKGFGWVRVFRRVAKDNDAGYWATNDLGMHEGKRGELEWAGWGIEVYHRGIKGCCGVERAQVRKKAFIVGHLLLVLWAFLRLEAYRLRTGVSWYESKASLIREAIRSYLANPIHILHLAA